MNLIVTCPRHFESETQEEIRKILNEFGDDTPATFFTGLTGIISVKTRLEPTEIVKKIREKIKDEPWTLRYILRVIPIDISVTSEVEEIVIQALKLASKIKKDASYKILIEKRHVNISSIELISKIAEKIPNKVNLDNPDQILLIEILGNRTGISLLKNDDILSVIKEKRALSE